MHVECAPLTTLEVLSESTERGDRSDKFYAYRRLASLMEYVLVAQDACRVEVYRRATDWDLEIYGEGQRFHLAALDGELSVDDICRDVLPP
jgi:Uma2 family endonuclease